MFRAFIAGLMAAMLAGMAAAQDGSWSDAGRLETARAGLSAAVLDGRLYAAGGAGLTEPRNNFEAYDPAHNEWRPLRPLPVGLERFGMAAAAGRIYVAGGYAARPQVTESFGAARDFAAAARDAREAARPVADMWSYDPAADVWQRETAMPGPKAGFVMAAIGDRVYALGGEAGAAGVFVFDTLTRTWQTLSAPEEAARRGAAAVVTGDEIWLIGGVRAGVASARVDIFDPASGDWRRGPDLPSPRAGHSAAVSGGVIHVFGGRSPDLGQTLSDHIALDTGEARWRTRSELPSPRTDAAAAALDGRVFLVGGGAGGGFFAPFTAIDSADVFTPR